MVCPTCAEKGKSIDMVFLKQKYVRYTDGVLLMTNYICPTQKRSGKRPHGCGKLFENTRMIPNGQGT